MFSTLHMTYNIPYKSSINVMVITHTQKYDVIYITVNKELY